MINQMMKIEKHHETGSGPNLIIHTNYKKFEKSLLGAV